MHKRIESVSAALAVIVLSFAIGDGKFVSAQQDVLAQQERQGTDIRGDGTGSQNLDTDGMDAVNQSPPPVEETPDLKASADQAQFEFDSAREQLAAALLEMRKTYIRFQNNEDQSPDAVRRYREFRDQSRRLMKETFEAADQLLQLRLVPDAVTFVGTTVQHREKFDIYDFPTMRAAAQLIDGEARELFLFLAAGRSAVSVGEFALAKRIYEAIGEEQVEDIDRALMYNIDRFEEQWKEEVIRREEDKAKELPRVRLKTTRGEAVLELFIDSAPSTVSHFIQLVEDGFYDGLDFYQVIDHILALTGDPSGDGRGNTGQFLVDEHSREDARKAFRGSLVMAKVPVGESGNFVPDSASCQFAILFLPVLTASESQTIFGRVIEGMDVISSLQRIDPSEKDKKKKVIIPPDRILTAEVIRRPEELPVPKFVDLKKAMAEAQKHRQHGHSEAEHE